MPAPGRITLTAMLNDAGRIVGEFTVARATEADEFHLFGSLPAEVHHSRWFRHHLPSDGSVRFEVLGLGLVGLSVAGPRSRDVLQSIAPDLDLSTEAFPFMTFRRVDLGMTPVHLARINYAGDLGYELWVAPEYQRELFDRIVAAGEPHGLRLFGMRALMSLRLEKSYGTWFREYRPIYTPPEAGITRYVKLDHEFIGRAAYEARDAAAGPKRRLVAFVVEPDPDDPADVIGDEPIWHDDEVVGWVTSGGYGHHVKESIALGYVPAASWRRPTVRAAAASRSRSSAGGGRHGSSRSRCSTRRAPDAPVTERPARAGEIGRIVVDGRPIEFRAGDSVAVAVIRARRGAGPRRHPLPGRRLRELPRGRSTGWRTCGPARSGPAGNEVVRPPGDGRTRPPGRAADLPRDAVGRRSRSRRGGRVAVIGGGRAAGRPRRPARPERRLVLDAGDGVEVVGIYPGPTVVARTPRRNAPRRRR